MRLDDLIADLRVQIQTGRCIVVTGAGTSIMATDNDPRASWIGLLEDGASAAAEDDAEWLTRIRQKLSSGTVEDLFPVADEIVSRLKANGAVQSRYRRWLQQSVGSLIATKPDILHRLSALGSPIITTNYDSLIEDTRGDGRSVAWNDFARVQRVLRGDDNSVIHLHGHWNDPENVILSMSSYLKKQDHKITELQRSAALMHSLIFVGVGEGMRDPDFSTLLAWTTHIGRDTGYTHYRLCLTGEVKKLRDQHYYHNIEVVPFGEKFEQLPEFLALLEPAKLTPAPAFQLEPRPKALIDDLNEVLIDGYAKSQGIGHDPRLQGKNRLKKLRLVDDSGDLFDWALLCFADRPSVFFPGAEVKLVNIDSRHVYSVTGPLSEQVTECMGALRTLIKMPQLDDKGAQVFFEALREAISNAIVHRDYHVPTATRVLYSGDGVEVHSPGGLPSSIDRSAVLLGISQPPHPHRARLLHYLGAAEGAGLGFESFRSFQAALGKFPGADISVVEDSGLIKTTLRVPRRAPEEGTRTSATPSPRSLEQANGSERDVPSEPTLSSIGTSPLRSNLESLPSRPGGDEAGGSAKETAVAEEGVVVAESNSSQPTEDGRSSNPDPEITAIAHESRASFPKASPPVSRGSAVDQKQSDQGNGGTPAEELLVNLTPLVEAVREVGSDGAPPVPDARILCCGDEDSVGAWSSWFEEVEERSRGLGAKDVLVSPKELTTLDAPNGWARAQRDQSQRSLAEVLAASPLRAVITVGALTTDNLLAVVVSALLENGRTIGLVDDKAIDENHLEILTDKSRQVLPVVASAETVRAYYPISEVSDEFLIVTPQSLGAIPFGMEAEVWRFDRIREDALFRLLTPVARGELKAEPAASAVLKRLVLTPQDVGSVNKAVRPLGEGSSMVDLLTSVERRSSWLGLDIQRLRAIVSFSWPGAFPASTGEIDLTGEAIDRWLGQRMRQYWIASGSWSTAVGALSAALLVFLMQLPVLDAAVGAGWLLVSAATGLFTRVRVGVVYGSQLLSVIPVAIVEVALPLVLIVGFNKPAGLVLWTLGGSVVVYAICRLIGLSKRDSLERNITAGAHYSGARDAEHVLDAAEKLGIINKTSIGEKYGTPKGRHVDGLKNRYFLSDESIFGWLSQSK